MVKISMFFLQLIRLPIIWMGADYEQLKLVLQTKLTMDFRRGPSVIQSAGKSKQTFGRQLLMFMVMGIFMAFSFIRIHDVLLVYTITFSVIMVMTAASLINEFTSVLFDQNDNMILLVRPVSNKTLLLSRFLHIQFYIMFIALALSAISLIITVFMFGLIAAFLFLLGVMLSTWISLLITSFFYLLLTKFVSADKFKDIITYVQIFLIILIMGGYQVLPRLVEINTLVNYSMDIGFWAYSLPPVWLAALVQLSNPEYVKLSVVILSLLALLGSFIGGVLTVRFLSKGFGDVLTQSSETVKLKHQNNIKSLNRFTFFKKILCNSAFEEAGWKLVMSVTHRDRKFKQAVYPSFGLMIILGFAMLRPDLNNFTEWFRNLPNTQNYFVFIFFGFFATTSLVQLQYTDTPEAAWVYKSLPVATPGHILSGAIKAMLAKYFVPMYILLLSTVLIIWGIKLLPIMLLGALLTITSTLISIIFQTPVLPFSQPRIMQQKGMNNIKVFLGLLFMGVVVGIVYFLSLAPLWGLIVAAVISLLTNVLLFIYIRKLTFPFNED
jgi:ABC-2 type transport system permease protein